MSAPRRPGKKLLVAAIGVATVTYASAESGCSDTHMTTSGNLMAPPPTDLDAGTDGSIVVSGNLLPPPPVDAGKD